MRIKNNSFVWTVIALLIPLIFAVVASAQTTVDQRVRLGGWDLVSAPADTVFVSASPEQFGDQLGVKVTYEVPAAGDLQVYLILTDLCSETNGINRKGWRKQRIGRFTITGAFWDVTGRVEPGTYQVCSYVYSNS